LAKLAVLSLFIVAQLIKFSSPKICGVITLPIAGG